MNNGYSRSQQRREAARKYAVQCMNARGEVECSECNAGVEEARGNRNAQELDREGIRKSGKGPICNACQASWRYSHHQEPEMANDRPPFVCDQCGKTKDRREYSHSSGKAKYCTTCAQENRDMKNADDNGPSDADVHAMAQKMFKDSWDNLSSKQQDQVYAALEKEMKNADNAKCQCGHTYDQHEEDPKGIKGASGSMPCTKCSCSSYYPERLPVKNATNIDPRYRTACPKGQGGEGCDWVESKETDDAYWFKCQRCGRVVIVSKG